MTVYRLKHIPTGMYYCPSREIHITINGEWHYIKSNLAKKGKVYTARPSFKWIENGFYNHLQFIGITSTDYYDRHKLCPFIAIDWIIEEI